MFPFKLNMDSQRNVMSDTGMNCTFIANSDTSIIDENIEKHGNITLKPATTIGNLSPRGSVYLMLKRFFTREDINRQLAKIKP